MAGKKLEYQIDVDSSQGIQGLKQFSTAVSRELKNIEDSFDDSAGAGEKVAAALKAIAAAADAELTEAAAAAEKLSVALGPELTGRMDIGAVVGDLNRMGLSFEEIAADADKLADALRDIDKVEVRGVESGLGKVKTGTDDMADSARGANSALANMIGNASQDLGVLGGIAGSAGVAIGQMAEYAADAALGGEKLGSALRSMALVVGPIAAITAAVSAISGVMAEIAAESEAAATRTKAVGDAMDATAVDAVGMSDALKGNVADLRNLNVQASTFSGLTSQYFASILRGLPLIGGVISDNGTDIVEILNDANLSMYDLARAGLVGSEGWKLFSQGAEEAFDAGKITEEQLEALLDVGFKYAKANDENAEAQQAFNVDLRAANELLDEMLAKDRPLEQYGDTWKTLFDDLADGRIDTQAAADAVNFLAEALGRTPDEILALANAHLDQVMQDNADATADAAAEQEAYNDRLLDTIRNQEDVKGAVRQAQVAIGRLANTFSQMKIRGETLSNLFELGNAPLDALGSMHDIEGGIDDLRHFLRDEGVPDIFDPDDVDAGPFLDKIDSLRGPIQEKITAAFEAGGPEAAKATADSYIDSIVHELHGKLTHDQVETLLGLGDLEAIIKVALEQTTLENVKQQLEILTGISGETPWTASIALALDAGTITPQAAEILVQAALKGRGVLIPSKLDTPDTAAAMREAAAFAAENGIVIPLDADPTKSEDTITDHRNKQRPPIVLNVESLPTGLDETAAVIGEGPGGRGWPPISVPVTLDWSHTQGPGSSSSGASPVPSTLAVGPTAMGATVTPMAGPSLAPVTIPVAYAGGAATQQVTQYITVQAAVIGDPFAVSAAIEDGVRRANRLNPLVA
jgi:hypothetical protein